MPLIYLLEAERLLFRLFLLMVIAGLVRRIVLSFRLRPAPAPAPAPVSFVSVLIPTRNEPTTAAITAAAALTHPDLQILVLDDSDLTHPALARNQALVATLAASHPHLQITHLHRAAPTGAKAGNLNHGLTHARGDFIAILDADHAPAPDFLTRLLPAFADPTVVHVQARNDFENRSTSLATRVQALLLDGLMALEQPLQSQRRRPLHSNGSSCIWRRSAVAAGFSETTAAEDLELSVRAQLAGGRLVHRADVVVPCELPDLAGLRSQQRRWTRGKLEVARSHAAAIVRAPLGLLARLDLLVPAASRLLFPLLALLAVTMPLTTFLWLRPLVYYSPRQDALLLGAVTAAATLYYARAARLAGHSAWNALLTPALIALLFGLALPCAAAFARGLLPGRPHFEPTRSARRPWSALLELAAALAYAGFTALALHRHLYPAAAFFAFVTVSFGWVAGGALLRRR